MERAIFPNRLAPPTPTAVTSSNPNTNNTPPRVIKLNSITLPVNPQSQPSSSPPSSFPVDSLLQHLLHSSSPPTITPANQLTPVRQRSGPATAVDNAELENGSLEFMSYRGKSMLEPIVEQPVAGLNAMFDSRKLELVEIDLASLLKGLESLGCWDKAVTSLINLIVS